MEEAVYFSAITLATTGYGEVTLDATWRLVSTLEGVNGILLFGWTTAFPFKVSALLWCDQTTPAEPEGLQRWLV